MRQTLKHTEGIFPQNDTYGISVIGKVVNITADDSVMVNGKIE